MPKFEVVSEYTPSGDQPEAIAALAAGIENGLDEQTLLGVTGSGKTYTMAKVIEAVQRPTLILAHNKTLAAQLCAEFREFFPNNAVEYFVSYYDYYQPEAYIPHTDTFIEKDSSVNEEIDRLRLSATASLLERRDVIVVSSVSCIYGLGEPEDFAKMMVSLRVGAQLERDEMLKKLVAIRYERNDIAFERNMFRVRGDTVEIWPAYWRDTAIRVEFFGDEIDRLSEINVVSGAAIRRLEHIPIYPASHYITPRDKMAAAIQEIYRELEERVAFFESSNMLVEAQRVKQRTMYDIEMLQELGFCFGIENYSRPISGRAAARLLARVFRRSRKAPRTTRKKNASSPASTAGFSRRTQRRTAESTLGAGKNFAAGTSKRTSVSMWYWSHRVKAPPSEEPWGAASRRATSLWRSTVTLSKQVASASFVSTGVVML